MSKGWDNNMLKKLKMLIGKGLSASEIGKKLEVSKNAVIGKLNRLGWNAKAIEAPAKNNKTKKDVKVVTKKATLAKVNEKTKKTSDFKAYFARIALFGRICGFRSDESTCAYGRKNASQLCVKKLKNVQAC